jgi:transposase InsO family protein
MDFHHLSRDKAGFDCVWVVIDRFRKQVISISYYRTVIARELARIFLNQIYHYYGPLNTIVSDHGPQFISDF